MADKKPIPEPEHKPTSGGMLTFMGMALLLLGVIALALMSSVLVKYKFDFWDVLFAMIALVILSTIWDKWRGGDKQK